MPRCFGRETRDLLLAELGLSAALVALHVSKPFIRKRALSEMAVAGVYKTNLFAARLSRTLVVDR